MTNFTVTTLADEVDPNDGQLSLREAIALANADTSADSISFGSLTGTIYPAGQGERRRGGGEPSGPRHQRGWRRQR